MKTSSWNPHRRDVLRTLGGGLLVPAAAALPSRARAADPISLNVWQWIPDFDVQVDLFNKAHTDVKLVQLNVGNSAQQSVKLRNVLTARSGGPDIVMFTYAMTNGFSRLGAMLDLTPLGASELKSKFTNYAWSELESERQNLRLAAGQRSAGADVPAGPPRSVRREGPRKLGRVCGCRREGTVEVADDIHDRLSIQPRRVDHGAALAAGLARLRDDR